MVYYIKLGRKCDDRQPVDRDCSLVLKKNTEKLLLKFLLLIDFSYFLFWITLLLLVNKVVLNYEKTQLENVKNIYSTK